ncbi:MAG: VPS10 domain-containing protein, partial [Longimicrobiales bacterium]
GTWRSRFLHPGVRCGMTLLLLASLAVLPAGAQGRNPTLTTTDLQGYRWRELGPAVTSGRITAFAVRPDDPDVIFAATASGGAWKTENGGTTWRPVFHEEGSVSLGAISLDPSNPEVVWIGTGEQNSVRSSSFGDGVYRSDDGGESWQHMGLRESRHVGRILIHPNDPDVVFVAAMGSLWGPNPERGLYKTTDGGSNWAKVLGPSEYTGVVEVVMDPRNPDILFAATFQRERRQWSMLGGGPESGLFRSTDGGETWSRVEGGFATGNLGRIGITYCPGSPEILFASAVGPDGGIFRSADGGATWERRNGAIQSHWYYGEVVCDPADPDRLYVPMTPLYVSDDGGTTFRDLVRTAVHVDHHTLWVNPDDPTHLMVGNDGGIYISRDRGESWLWQSNLPVMQLYTVSVDMQDPFYHVYGGTQDNGSWGGPVGTRFGGGVSLEDWTHTVGGDGFYSQVDPTDSDIVYAESQYGVLYRMDRRTGERRRVQPWQPQADSVSSYRWNWSAPVAISPHDPGTLYFAANVVFRSRDRGDSWEVISADLTRQISRDSLPLQGRVQPSDAVDLHASTALYGNISTLSISPVRPGLVAAGTDDGLVQVTADDGATWKKTDRFPGVPEMMKVGMVVWSSTAEGTLFAVFDGHKDNIFQPFVVRSEDFGASWSNVTGDLPAFGPTRSVAVHPRNGNLVFVGTEFGVFVSSQGGERWLQLGQGLPTVAVHGIVVHPRENDLVLGTHGRGFWVLDDLGLLEGLTPDVLGGDAYLALPRRATQIRDVDRGRGSLGDTYWIAQNPPRGAILDYWIGEAAVGLPFRLDVSDPRGDVVRVVAEGTAERGAHRVIWDLRHEAPLAPNGRPSTRARGRFVLPGSYQVRLEVGDREYTRALFVRMDPGLAVDEETRKDLDRTLALQADLVGAAAVVGPVIDTVAAHAEVVLDALSGHPDAPRQVAGNARAVLTEVQRLRAVLSGPGGGGIAQQETVLPLGTLVGRLYSTTEAWTGSPTEDQRRLTRQAHGDMAKLITELRDLIDNQLPELRQALAETGISWPAGEAPTLPDPLIPPYES